MLEIIGIIIVSLLLWKIVNRTIKNSRDQEYGSPRATVDVLDKIENISRPQINQLTAEGTRITLSDITYVYIGALALSLSKNGVSLNEVKELVKSIFSEEEYSINIETAYAQACASDYLENVQYMFPIANSEMISGKGDFFIKFTKKLNKEIERMFDPNTDDIDVKYKSINRTWFLDV